MAVSDSYIRVPEVVKRPENMTQTQIALVHLTQYSLYRLVLKRRNVSFTELRDLCE